MSTTLPPPGIEIEYPDSDGQPMAENTLQFQWIVTVKEGLEAVFRNDPNVFVAGDLLWYPVKGQPGIRTAPDAMVVFGRPKGYRGSYKQWEEDGIAPQVVFEILSPGNRPTELVEKLKFYERYGVEEYYQYDPDHGPLRAWKRGESGLEEIPQTYGYTSPRLGVTFLPGEGPDNLKLIAPNGRPLETYAELYESREAQEQRAWASTRRARAAAKRAQAEKKRAEAERKRAEAERKRAEAADKRIEAAVEQIEASAKRMQAAEERAQTAEERAERLAAKLRELGVELD
ncbi:MAG: Uma2 family endonuclease [Planctomycetaceae bacterium]|nr:Uma2 family endonuclease [Planctomycetaceae bacterium]